MLKCSESAIAGEVKPTKPGPRYLFQKSDFTIAHPFGLTECEDQVLRLTARGLSNMEIGQELDRSHRTIEIHRGRVIEKLEAKNTAHAIAIGFVSGILTGEDLEEG